MHEIDIDLSRANQTLTGKPRSISIDMDLLSDVVDESLDWISEKSGYLVHDIIPYTIKLLSLKICSTETNIVLEYAKIQKELDKKQYLIRDLERENEQVA